MDILIHGIGGRMGRAVLAALKENKEARAVAGVDKFATASDFGALPVFKNIEDVNVPVDCIIDFSSKDAVYDILTYAAARNIPAVLATTGYGPEENNWVTLCSKKIPVFRSGNMSLGINVLTRLVKKTAEMLYGKADIEIIESHHNQKVDAPSGTALMLFNAVKEIQKDAVPVYGREGICGKRTENEVGIHAVRGGTIVGKHEVMFIMNNEVITVKHEAESRSILALGAINAALFLKGKQPGLYNMNDLLENL